MGVDGVDIARTLRERRRALGLTRARLAEQTGITTVDLTRWERGDGTPDGDAVIVLAEAIGLEVTETQAWLDQVVVDVTGPDISVQLVESSEAPSDPFLNRSALLKAEPSWLTRVADRLHRRDAAKEEVGEAAVTPLRRTEQAPRRPAPSPSTGLVRQPMRVSHLPSVFPEPAIAPYDPEVRIYSAASARPLSDEEEQLYLLRRLRTGAALIGLALVLWWALGSLWEGFGDVIQLFRTPVVGG